MPLWFLATGGFFSLIWKMRRRATFPLCALRLSHFGSNPIKALLAVIRDENGLPRSEGGRTPVLWDNPLGMLDFVCFPVLHGESPLAK